MSAGQVVHVVVPEGIDDPTTPSGGNVYDRRLCQELLRAGWTVEEHAVTQTLPEVLGRLPYDALTLVDGLVAVAAPEAMIREAERLRLVVLLHMPFGERDPSIRAQERRVLAAVDTVVTTSEWSRRWVLRHYGLLPWDVHVAQPGADAAELASGSESGARLVCVAAVTRDKGHEVLLTALAGTDDVPWRLTCAGSLAKEGRVALSAQHTAAAHGLAERVTWAGAVSREELDKCYAEADVLVLASRAESWGMVVTESLARGIPVLAAEVGGLPEALGTSPEGVPGLLVPADDPSALAGALRRWLEDDSLRAGLRAAARSRRTTLTGWSTTATRVAAVLEDVAR
jgi:glycosyltransferase involved in cell wall biosynthesis